MDDKRFDAITRKLVSGRSRRSFLGAAVASLFGFRAAETDAACRPGGYSCQRDTDCCSGACYATSKTGRQRVCQACQPTTCKILGKNCGTYPDGCGGTLNCGDCGQCGTCNEGACAQVAEFNCGQCRSCQASNGKFDCLPDDSRICNDDNRCTNNERCVAGTCVGTFNCNNLSGNACCPTGQGCCPNGSCVTLGADPNCQACGQNCSNTPGQACGGVDVGCVQLGTTSNCSAPGDVCAAGQLCCGNACVTPNTAEHCGTCASCPAGNFCYDDNSPDTFQCRTCIFEGEPCAQGQDALCCQTVAEPATCTGGFCVVH